MKKLLVVVMSIIMVLSLCACGGKGAGGNGGLLSSEPTEQENGVISTYVNILNALGSYLEDGDISIYDVENEVDVEGSKALEYCYKTIQDLESVDKWIGTEYISDTRTRKEILDSFTVVKDVKLQDTVVRLDFLGNVDGDAEIGTYTYNAKGEIIEGYVSKVDIVLILGNYKNIGIDFVMRQEFEGDMQYTCTYAETGEIENIQNEYARVTPIYDNVGRIASVEYLSAEGYKATYPLSYDNQNRLSKIEVIDVEIDDIGREDKTVDTYNFTYDDNNNLLKEEYVHQNFVDNEKWVEEVIVVDYDYDANGKLTSANRSSSEGWKTKILVNYDKEGSLVTYNIEYLDEEGNVDSMYKQERICGDFYVYNPNK